MSSFKHIDRRHLLAGFGASTVTALLPGASGAWWQQGSSRPIPSTNESIPSIGLGSWITFNVGNNKQALERSTRVIREFFAAGGRMIDCSPMYGSSQDTIGHALAEIDPRDQLFSAEKVWIRAAGRGPGQIAASLSLWGIPQFDLLQVHNLLSWERHLETLFAMKAAGTLRYVGVTTSHGRRHRELERIMTSQPVDFVQLTYNMSNRAAERRLLPLAHERNIAVIANRPFDGGRLIRTAKRHPLPDWAGKIGIRNWAQFLLGFITSHPSLTVAIPATTRVDHVRENMSTLKLPFLEETDRQRMANVIERL